MINANRNLGAYEAFGVPVWPDVLADYPGPLAGFLTALERCETPWLVTVPCDTPLFPHDLVARLAQAAQEQNAEIAMAAAREEDGQIRTQPVFCLIRIALMESLVRFTHDGGRKIDAWTALHKTVVVTFDAARATSPRPFSTPIRWQSCTSSSVHEDDRSDRGAAAGLRSAGPERGWRQ